MSPGPYIYSLGPYFKAQIFIPIAQVFLSKSLVLIIYPRSLCVTINHLHAKVH